MPTLVQKFMQSKEIVGRSIDNGAFSVCYDNSKTTVIVQTYGLHNGFVKLLTGLTLNAYFREKWNIDYLLGVKHSDGYFSFLVKKLDTNYKHVPYFNYEDNFQKSELGNMYKAIFYPYLPSYKQKDIAELWLDAKYPNCGMFRSELILFDSIPYVDDEKISYNEFANLCKVVRIPYHDNL